MYNLLLPIEDKNCKKKKKKMELWDKGTYCGLSESSSKEEVFSKASFRISIA